MGEVAVDQEEAAGEKEEAREGECGGNNVEARGGGQNGKWVGFG